MKLGIIGAMSIEVDALKSCMTDMESVERAGMTFYTGKLEDVPAVVVVCGVGKVNAALCVQVLCDCFNVTHIVNTGVAGSLDAKLDIGDLVISTEAIYHDFDCHAINPNYIVGQVPGLSVRAFPADQALAESAFAAATECGDCNVCMGVIASGDQFVSSGSQKKQIVQDTGALCTDMEGAAIAHASWKNKIPFVVIRAISDKADDSAQMDYPTFEAIAAQRCAGVTRCMAKRFAE